MIGNWWVSTEVMTTMRSLFFLEIWWSWLRESDLWQWKWHLISFVWQNVSVNESTCVHVYVCKCECVWQTSVSEPVFYIVMLWQSKINQHLGKKDKVMTFQKHHMHWHVCICKYTKGWYGMEGDGVSAYGAIVMTHQWRRRVFSLKEEILEL